MQRNQQIFSQAKIHLWKKNYHSKATKQFRGRVITEALPQKIKNNPMIKEGWFGYYNNRLYPQKLAIICICKDKNLFYSTIASRFDDEHEEGYYKELFKGQPWSVIYRRNLLIIFTPEIEDTYLNPIKLEVVRLWRRYVLNMEDQQMDRRIYSSDEMGIARKINSLYKEMTNDRINEIQDNSRIDEGIPTPIPC